MKAESLAWWAVWTCWCATLEPDRGDVPDRCPEHDAPFDEAPALTFHTAGVEFGRRSDDEIPPPPRVIA